MNIDRRQTLLFAPTVLALAASPAIGGAETAPAPSREMGPRERVLGIGGFFFRGKDPAALAKWYRDHLGIDPIPTDYSHSGWRQAAGPTAFAPFPSDTTYIGPPEHQWMLNFRVRDLAAITAQLMADGVPVKVAAQAYPNGRFAHLHDPEGNAIELWEPANPADRTTG